MLLGTSAFAFEAPSYEIAACCRHSTKFESLRLTFVTSAEPVANDALEERLKVTDDSSRKKIETHQRLDRKN